jgi:hypothetical protein
LFGTQGTLTKKTETYMNPWHGVFKSDLITQEEEEEKEVKEDAAGCCM